MSGGGAGCQQIVMQVYRMQENTTGRPLNIQSTLQSTGDKARPVTVRYGSPGMICTLMFTII